LVGSTYAGSRPVTRSVESVTTTTAATASNAIFNAFIISSSLRLASDIPKHGAYAIERERCGYSPGWSHRRRRTIDHRCDRGRGEQITERACGLTQKG